MKIFAYGMKIFAIYFLFYEVGNKKMGENWVERNDFGRDLNVSEVVRGGMRLSRMAKAA